MNHPIHERQIPKSLRKIVEACHRRSILTPRDAADILQSVDVRVEDLLPWAQFDHPVRDSYGRRAVVLGETFELMIMSWNPGDFSAIHDHGHTQWGAVMYFGEAEHAVYDLDGMVLRTRERTTMRSGQVNLVDHDLIHQMGNPGDQPFLSLHLYGCAEPVDGITGDARIFDLLNSEIQHTDGGVFYCLPEELISHRGGTVLADRETTLEHHQQMLDRVRRVQSTLGNTDDDLDVTAERLHRAMDALGQPAGRRGQRAGVCMT